MDIKARKIFVRNCLWYHVDTERARIPAEKTQAFVQMLGYYLLYHVQDAVVQPTPFQSLKSYASKGMSTRDTKDDMDKEYRCVFPVVTTQDDEKTELHICDNPTLPHDSSGWFLCHKHFAECVTLIMQSPCIGHIVISRSLNDNNQDTYKEEMQWYPLQTQKEQQDLNEFLFHDGDGNKKYDFDQKDISVKTGGRLHLHPFLYILCHGQKQFLHTMGPVQHLYKLYNNDNTDTDQHINKHNYRYITWIQRLLENRQNYYNVDMRNIYQSQRNTIEILNTEVQRIDYLLERNAPFMTYINKNQQSLSTQPRLTPPEPPQKTEEKGFCSDVSRAYNAGMYLMMVLGVAYTKNMSEIQAYLSKQARNATATATAAQEAAQLEAAQARNETATAQLEAEQARNATATARAAQEAAQLEAEQARNATATARAAQEAAQRQLKEQAKRLEQKIQNKLAADNAFKTWSNAVNSHNQLDKDWSQIRSEFRDPKDMAKSKSVMDEARQALHRAVIKLPEEQRKNFSHRIAQKLETSKIRVYLNHVMNIPGELFQSYIGCTTKQDTEALKLLMTNNRDLTLDVIHRDLPALSQVMEVFYAHKMKNLDLFASATLLAASRAWFDEDWPEHYRDPGSLKQRIRLIIHQYVLLHAFVIPDTLQVTEALDSMVHDIATAIPPSYYMSPRSQILRWVGEAIQSGTFDPAIQKFFAKAGVDFSQMDAKAALRPLKTLIAPPQNNTGIAFPAAVSDLDMKIRYEIETGRDPINVWNMPTLVKQYKEDQVKVTNVKYIYGRLEPIYDTVHYLRLEWKTKVLANIQRLCNEEYIYDEGQIDKLKKSLQNIVEEQIITPLYNNHTLLHITSFNSANGVVVLEDQTVNVWAWVDAMFHESLVTKYKKIVSRSTADVRHAIAKHIRQITGLDILDVGKGMDLLNIGGEFKN